MELGKRTRYNTQIITMTERQGRTGPKAHEVEEPDRHRLDMLEAERCRQGPGEAWPPPLVSDR